MPTLAVRTAGVWRRASDRGTAGGDESGFSLIELLIALVLMGVVVVGVVGMLGTLVITSVQAQTQAQAESIARSSAEVVRALVYQACPPGLAGNYQTALAGVYSDAANNNLGAIAQGYTVRVTGVEFLRYQQTTPGQVTNKLVMTQNCSEAMVQQVSLAVDSSDGVERAQAVVTKRRPCASRFNGAVGCT